MIEKFTNMIRNKNTSAFVTVSSRQMTAALLSTECQIIGTRYCRLIIL